MPQTKFGKWSIGLISLFILFLLVFYGVALTGQKGGNKFFDNLTLAIPLLLAGSSGLAGLVTGIAGIIMKKERNALVYLAVLIGALVVLFISGEIFSPH